MERDRIESPPPKPTSEYRDFREYFDAEILPTLGQDRNPPVTIGYANLKRR